MRRTRAPLRVAVKRATAVQFRPFSPSPCPSLSPPGFPMPNHPPFSYHRTSSDFDRECRGERPLRWLWQDKIPLGKLTLIEGPPAVGKLFVALDIAARVSTGALGGEWHAAAGETPAPQIATPMSAAATPDAPAQAEAGAPTTPPP